MPIKIGDLELYDVEELSKLLNVPDRSVRKMLNQGKLRGRKIAKKWYVTADSLRQYFEEPEPKDGTSTPEITAPSNSQ